MAKPFHFKQFTVHHHRCAMKVGTDAVLLGTWTAVGVANRILEIGTGSGVIALMLAQRTNQNVEIDAVEILAEDAAQAEQNFIQSPWAAKIKMHHTAIQGFNAAPYDLIVCNPPFFSNSLLPPSGKRKIARHTLSITQPELVKQVDRLLSQKGRFALILPVEEGEKFKTVAGKANLHCNRKMAIYTRMNKPQERWLLEFSREKKGGPHRESLTLYGQGENWSSAYKDLTKSFYLNL